MKKIALIAALICAAIGQPGLAKTITIDFVGHTGTNPGLPGAGQVAGQIVYDTSSATAPDPTQPSRFVDVWDMVNFTVNGARIQSQGAPSNNSLTQVLLGGPSDAFNSERAGGYASTGVSGVTVADVDLELRL
jgi:hypothetical protein